MDETFPGLLTELVADGSPVWDEGELFKLCLSFGGQMVRSGKAAVDHKAMATYLASRPFLECHVRRRLTAIGNVTVPGGHDVAELTSDGGSQSRHRVRVVNRDGGAEQESTADLVMDAMGRGAHTPAFLESQATAVRSRTTSSRI